MMPFGSFSSLSQLTTTGVAGIAVLGPSVHSTKQWPLQVYGQENQQITPLISAIAGMDPATQVEAMV